MYEKIINSIQGVLPVFKFLKCLITAPFRNYHSRRAIRGLANDELTTTYYSELYCIWNDKEYTKYLSLSHEKTKKLISKKSEKGERIKIAFQISLISVWVGDELVNKFQKDDRFDVTIIIVWQTNTSKFEVETLKEYFKVRSFKYVVADGTLHPGDFDIVFYTSPYLNILENWSENDIPLSTLTCYIPYGFLIAAIQNLQFNLFIHNTIWKNFCIAKDYQDMANKYCRIGKMGMVYSGYPKLDRAYNLKCGINVLWKNPRKSANIKKIIYAPHHSINDEPYYSTFAENKDFILNYARNHVETTSWVFKPHPLLKVRAVTSGLFKSEERYEEYVNEWRNLPNAIVLDGEYLDYMASSDAMIFDSISFMAEYLYFNKPALFLTRENEKMNEFGSKVLDILYHVSGKNLMGIADFIENGIENDSKFVERSRFFTKYLDYYKENRKLASDFIYSDVVKDIFSCNV